MKWIKIFPSNILKDGDFVKKITVSGKNVCAVKTGEKLYVVQLKCPHAGADLSKGWCSKGNLVCPYHRHEFNLETGRGKEGQGNYIRKFSLDKRDDGIYLGLRDSWWKFW